VSERIATCEEGKHKVDLHPVDRPLRLTCIDCGKVFVRDPSWAQGYRPEDKPSKVNL
jgi:hypothetical protein